MAAAWLLPAALSGVTAAAGRASTLRSRLAETQLQRLRPSQTTALLSAGAPFSQALEKEPYYDGLKTSRPGPAAWYRGTSTTGAAWRACRRRIDALLA